MEIGRDVFSMEWNRKLKGREAGRRNFFRRECDSGKEGKLDRHREAFKGFLSGREVKPESPPLA